MSETKENETKAGEQGRQAVGHKRTVEIGHTQQQFGNRRTKSVVVEQRKSFKYPGGGEARPEAAAAAKPAAAKAPEAQRPRPQTGSGAPQRNDAPRPGTAGRTLSDQERLKRMAALKVEQGRAVDEQSAPAPAPIMPTVVTPPPAPVAAVVQAPVAEAPTSPVAATPASSAPAAAGAAPQPVAAKAPAAAAAPVAAAPAAAPPTAASAMAAGAAAPNAGAPAKELSPLPVARTVPPATTTATSARPAAPAGSMPPRPATSAPATGRPPQPPRTGYVAGARPQSSTGAPRPPAAPGQVGGQPVIRPSVGMTRPVIVSNRYRPKPLDATPPAKPEVEALRRQPRSLVPPTRVNKAEDEDAPRRRTGPGGAKVARAPEKPEKRTTDDRRERSKLTIQTALNDSQRERSLASLKRRREREKLKALGQLAPRDKIQREVVIPEVITIQELANRMTERAVDIIKFLMKQDTMHKINDVIDADTAELIVAEFGHKAKRVSEADVEAGFISAKEKDETALILRAPVVTIMGHVDHGKTSLLDAIRKANVASGEAGGITQHIGAYRVVTPNGQPITFIDTPGHEAFTAMRARGAKVTDIVILVVAADDGVMPQTVEAIAHAKAAGVPLIVAINKMDKPQSDPTRVRTELLQHGIVVESMSGETLDVPVSAIKRTGLDKLLEAISLQAELLDLKANPTRSAEGYIIEAKLERGRGPVGTMLVQRGTLRVGDIVVAGMAWGRVRALIDDQGKNIKEAGPSVPVEVLGFDSAPEAGDQCAVVESEARAREITDYRIRKRRETMGSAGTARTLEQMMQQLKDADRKEFTLLVKGDVQGSVEAIAGALKKLSTDEVQARILHSGVGSITESDIALAHASKAVVVGFNVRANSQAKAMADRDGVEIRYYSIIYDLVDDVKAAMSGLLAPTVREVFLGNALVLEVFNISKVGKVAGCRITNGKVERGAKVRLLRDNVVIHEGSLSVLKRFKDDAKEVSAGQECGMSFANYQDIRQGDTIECFQVETVARTL